MSTTLIKKKRTPKVEVLKKFEQINNALAIGQILLNYGLLIGIAYFSLTQDNYLLLILGAIFASGFAHNLLSYAHDSAHYSLLKNRWWNDFIGGLCGLPAFVSIGRYRHDHLKHHAGLLTEEDPYYEMMQREHNWILPKSKTQLLFILFKDLIGITFMEKVRVFRSWLIIPFTNEEVPLTKTENFFLIPFSLALITFLSYAFGLKFLVFFTVLSNMLWFCTRIRAYGEHPYKDYHPHSDSSWTVIPSSWEWIWLHSGFIGFHNTHHYLPTIPNYNLKKAHQELMENDEHYASNNKTLHGYIIGKKTVLNEISQQA